MSLKAKNTKSSRREQKAEPRRQTEPPGTLASLQTGLRFVCFTKYPQNFVLVSTKLTGWHTF